MGNLYYGQMFGWGFGGMIMMLIFWAAVVFFIVWLVREARDDSRSRVSRSKSALDILDNRYAKGEIDKKEFEEKKKDLVD